MAWTKRDLERSYSCNPELFAFLRKHRGWTQAQLAHYAGYSKRLISKAEAGEPIRAQAISDLAEALSMPDEPVYPEDLISDPVELAKAYIAAEYKEQKNAFQAIKHFLDEDIVLLLEGDPAIFPFAGEHRGHAGVERAFAIFFSVIQAPANHDHTPWYTFHTRGNEVIIWGESWLHPIGQPMREPIKLVHRMKFLRGKIAFIEVLYDSLAGARALGYQPSMQNPEEYAS